MSEWMKTLAPALQGPKKDKVMETETTTATSLPSTSEGTGNIGNKQGNTSRPTTTQKTTASSIVTVASLADLRPGTEVHFRTLKEVDAETKQEVQITHTPKEARQL